eukprot:g5614.t1
MVRSRIFHLLSTVLLFSVACCDKKRDKRATGKVVQLSVRRVDELQDALFGGNVWVIACKKDSESMDPFFSEAAKLLSKNKECNGQCFAGTLDCRRKLPSKKSVLKRFNLRREGKQVPLLFLAANGNKPYQLNVKTFTKPMKGKKNTREFAAKKLVKHVAKVSKPKVWQILKPSDFQKYCLKRRYCVAFALGRNDGASKKEKKKRSGGMKGKSLTLNLHQKKVVSKLSVKHRNVAFVVIDTSKWKLEVLGKNIEGFQKRHDDVSATEYPAIVAFRKDKNDTTLGKGQYRHLNAQIQEGTSGISMSHCRHLIYSNTSKEEARKIFKANKIDFKNFKEKPLSLLRNKDILYRINKKYYTWKTAAPYMAAEAMFRNGLPSSVMSKIDKDTEREEKIRRKKAGTDVPVISAKMYHKSANMQTKQYFTESRLSKLIKNMAKDREFIMSSSPPVVTKFLSAAEKTKLEESKKRQKMQNLQKKRKRQKAAEKRSEKVKKRAERKMNRKRRGKGINKEELKKERARREHERREEMDREMEQFGVQAAPEEDEEESFDSVSDDAEDDSPVEEDGAKDSNSVSFDVEADGEGMISDDDDDTEEVVDLGDLEDDYDDEDYM